MPDPPTRLWHEAAVAAIRDARRVVVLSGAGMSAESGIPTFRDALTGLWARYRPEELATPEAFARHPGRVWDWYQARREKVHAALPHAGYAAMVALEARLPRLDVVTQNVDGLHQLAGSTRVLELHGNIRRSVCSVTRRVIDDDWLATHAGSPPPSPHHPDGLARPDVVWFGEALAPGVLERAWDLASRCDALLSVGTSALVQPAASLPLVAREAGATVIEINPRETPLSGSAHHRLRAPAGEALTALVEAL